MTGVHFDTFEDEKEVSQLIKNLQSKSIEYMKIKDTLDITPEEYSKEHENDICKV